MSYRFSRRGFLSSLATLPALRALAVTPPGRYVRLGKTGLNITKFVFGSMITSDPAVIERAFDMGINCFTTARDYQKGNNERLLGAALKGKRDQVILSTEAIDIMWRPKTEKETTAYVLDNLNLSLRELQTDYVDLFFLHHKDDPASIPDEALEAVRLAKQQGKIRHAGITTHALPNMADYLVRSEVFEAVIPMFNFTMDAQANASVKKVHDAGLGVIAMKVMAGGLRGDKALPQFNRDGALVAALKWAMHNPNVDAAVSSVVDMEQLEENFRAMSEPLTEDDRRLLAAALERISPLYCRMCGSCSGTCTKGLPVPEVLRCGMYAEGYGQLALGREKFRLLPEEVRASSCRECSSCSVRCAYGVRVAERMERTRAILG